MFVFETNYGSFTVELDFANAPISSKNFQNYADSGFYDGTIFHRVIPGFMIQGGDPNTRSTNRASYGTGGHAAKYYGIGDEASKNTWNLPAEFNKIRHTRGILSMARSNDPNSGGSQFFICAADAPHLDGQYTVFGKVTKGMELIDKIKKGNDPNGSVENPDKIISFSVIK